jgi:hypothetical protein
MESFLAITECRKVCTSTRCHFKQETAPSSESSVIDTIWTRCNLKETACSSETSVSVSFRHSTTHRGFLMKQTVAVRQTVTFDPKAHTSFTELLYRLWNSHSLPIQWLRGVFSTGVKTPRREADHSSPSTAEIKNAYIHTSTPPHVFMAWCLITQRMCLHGVVFR